MRVIAYIGAFFFIPLLYDLFKGSDALLAALKDDGKRFDLFALSLLSVVFVHFLLIP